MSRDVAKIYAGIDAFDPERSVDNLNGGDLERDGLIDIVLAPVES